MVFGIKWSTVRGEVLELGGVLTAKFLTQLTGLLVIQARLGEITALAILESETTISGRIVRVHHDRFLISFDGTCRVPGFRVRKPGGPGPSTPHRKMD